MRLWHVTLIAAVAVIVESFYHEVSWLILAKRTAVVLISFVVLTVTLPVARKLNTDQAVKWTEYVLPVLVGIPGMWGIYLLILR